MSFLLSELIIKVQDLAGVESGDADNIKFDKIGLYFGNNIDSIYPFERKNQVQVIKTIVESLVITKHAEFVQSLEAAMSLSNEPEIHFLVTERQLKVSELMNNKVWKEVRTKDATSLIDNVVGLALGAYNQCLINDEINKSLNKGKVFNKAFGKWINFCFVSLDIITVYVSAMALSQYINFLDVKLKELDDFKIEHHQKDRQYAGFEQYIIQNRERTMNLLSDLVKSIKSSKKTKKTILMILALKELGYVNSDIFANQTELHRRLTNSFKLSESREALNQNINLLDSVSSTERRIVDEYKELISSRLYNQ